MKSQIEEALGSTHFVLTGGRDIKLKVAQTESMSIKESVKNVMRAILVCTSLALFAGNCKHNLVIESYLQTTKSI